MRPERRATIGFVRAPLITIRLRLRRSTRGRLRRSVDVPRCGQDWDTSQIPAGRLRRLAQAACADIGFVLGPPLVLAAILIPLAVLVGIQIAFLLFVLDIAFALFVVPPMRRLVFVAACGATKSWKLRPE